MWVCFVFKFDSRGHQHRTALHGIAQTNHLKLNIPMACSVCSLWMTIHTESQWNTPSKKFFSIKCVNLYFDWFQSIMVLVLLVAEMNKAPCIQWPILVTYFDFVCYHWGEFISTILIFGMPKDNGKFTRFNIQFIIQYNWLKMREQVSQNRFFFFCSVDRLKLIYSI